MLTRETIAFTRGVPPVESFPVAEIAECALAALHADPNVLLQYGKSAGYLPLREWLAARNGVDVEQVLVSNGSLQLMEFISATLLGPGEVACVESPSYDRSIGTFRRHGAEVVGIPLQADGMDLDALERAVAARRPRLLYVIGDFQNPSGTTTSAAKRRAILDLAERFDFMVVEDVPYRPLRYYGQEEPTLLSLNPERVLQLSSFSKLLSPGVRTGYLLGPRAVVSRIAKVAEDIYITPVLPTQGMVYEYCRRGLLEPNIARLRALYRPKLEATLRALDGHLPGARFTRPQGGYYVGVDMPEGVDSRGLLVRAAEAGLVLSDGDGFFAQKPARAFVRIPFVCLSVAEIEEGVRRLAGVARTGR